VVVARHQHVAVQVDVHLQRAAASERPAQAGEGGGQFSRFYQGLGPDGGFVVQCTN
jgi:hypothetical protein